ncbi:DUF1571 domain-containing protein [Isosphaeraceae bacterium EP7]
MNSAKDRARRRRAAHLLLASFVAVSPALHGCSRFRDHRRPTLGKDVVVPGPSASTSGPIPIPVAGDLTPRAQTSRPSLVGDLIDLDSADGKATVTRSTAHPSTPPAAGPTDSPTPGALLAAQESSRIRAAATRPAPNALPPLDLPDISVPKLVVPPVDVPPVIAGAPVNEPGPKSEDEDEDEDVKMRQVLADARSKLDAIGNYQVKVRRQERVGSDLQPVEDITLSILRSPRAVRIEWPDGPNKGREVLFAGNGPDAKMHVKMPNPLIPRLSLAPDSPLVMRSGRHPITEAGFDTILANVEAPARSNDPAVGRVKYAGVESPQEVGRACYVLTRVTPSGEHWRVYLDTTTSLPAMVLAADAQGQLLERYVFDPPKVDLPELASVDAFDPNARWGQPSGLFGRLARGSSTEPVKTTTQ